MIMLKPNKSRTNHIIQIIPCKTALTLPVPSISESCIEIKIKFNFYFHTSLWCMKAFKALMKPFEAPQRSVKIKI